MLSQKGRNSRADLHGHRHPHKGDHRERRPRGLRGDRRGHKEVLHPPNVLNEGLGLGSEGAEDRDNEGDDAHADARGRAVCVIKVFAGGRMLKSVAPLQGVSSRALAAWWGGIRAGGRVHDLDVHEAEEAWSI